MLYVNKSIKNEIIGESEKAYPGECCGVLFGETDGDGNKELRQIWPITNAREENEQYHRFLITPEDMLKSELKARTLKLDVLGFYHSHPDCPAKPSDYDKEHALPFYSYIITSVLDGRADGFTSWELSADRESFNSEEILYQ